MPYMPLYLVQAMISSISLTAMLGGLYAALLWYVDAVERPGPRRYLTKFVVGTSHFLAHLTAMFTLSLTGGDAQQLDGAADRAAPQGALPHARASRPRSSATSSRNC